MQKAYTVNVDFELFFLFTRYAINLFWMDSIFASKTGIICLVSYVQNQCSGVDEEFALQLDLPFIPTQLCLALNDGFMDSCLMKLTGRCALQPWVQDGAGANRKKRKQRNTEPSHTITKCLPPPAKKKQKPPSEPTNLGLEPA